MLWVLLPLLLASAARPCAGQTVPADSAGRRTVQLGETRVDTVRYPAPGVSSFSPPRDLPPPGAYTTDLDAAALRSLGAGASVGAVLAQRTPLVVRQYGPGQLASLSVRGTTAQHVAVLWQGFNISFPTLGQADLSLLPTAALTGVSLLHGPDAARVGSGAVGGALTLATSAAPGAPGSTNAEAALSGGSFGQRAANARAFERQ